MGRPKSSPVRDTRRRILEAALELFAERGYQGTSMRALAGAVGVRESALYHYFPSKTALLEAVLADFAEARCSEPPDDLGPLSRRPLEDVLAAFAQRAVLELGSPQFRRLVRVMVTAGPALEPGGDPLWRRVTDGQRRRLARLLSQLRRAGRVRDDVELEIVALHLLAPLVIASNALFGEERSPLSIPLSRFMRQHVTFMARALNPPRTRHR